MFCTGYEKRNALTEMKITSQPCTTSLIDQQGTPFNSSNEAPRDKVRFQYRKGVKFFSFKCFWILIAIASPMDPRPIHPNRSGGEGVMLM